MKKLIMIFTTLVLVLTICAAHAVNYTLPEKMYNQLAIGSGLKGVFSISAEGERFDTPFLRTVTDAEFSIRGILSGKDLHYYIFQQKSEDQQAAVSELYRKDGMYYFRSDMVKDKILALPALSEFINAAFPAKGENTPATPFITKLLTLSESEKTTKWEPVLKRYQNELELWLADFTVLAESVKLENGLSALDFTYEIPMDKVFERIILLYSEFAADSEVSELLDSVMSQEEKQIYLNPNLMYYYEEALNSLTVESPVRMSKRVSAMGEMLRFRLEMPTDIRTTGYESIIIENADQHTVYTLKKPDEVMVISLPVKEAIQQTDFKQSLWFARISNKEEQQGDNVSVRIEISKNSETYNDDEEKNHQIDRYQIMISPDTACLPDDTDLSLLPMREEISIDLELHYSSKYAQNSATTLDINADIKQDNSSLHISGKLKTAAPWLFMPFEVVNPVTVGTNFQNELIPYFVDWISNASSMITHTAEEPVDIPMVPAEPEPVADEEQSGSDMPAADEQNHEADTAPLEASEDETAQE